VGPCLLLLYGQSISWSAEAHGVQWGGSVHVCTEDAGAVGKLLAVPYLFFSTAFSTPRSLAPLKNFHISFIVLDKLTHLFLELLCSSLVPTVQLPPLMGVTQLSS